MGMKPRTRKRIGSQPPGQTFVLGRDFLALRATEISWPLRFPLLQQFPPSDEGAREFR